jgi:hypothetical protein
MGSLGLEVRRTEKPQEFDRSGSPIQEAVDAKIRESVSGEPPADVADSGAQQVARNIVGASKKRDPGAASVTTEMVDGQKMIVLRVTGELGERLRAQTKYTDLIEGLRMGVAYMPESRSEMRAKIVEALQKLPNETAVVESHGAEALADVLLRPAHMRSSLDRVLRLVEAGRIEVGKPDSEG